MQHFQKKRGQLGLNQLSGAAIAVIVFIIIVGIGVTVLANIQEVVGDTECQNINSGLEYNETGNTCTFANGTAYGAGVGTNISGDGIVGMSLFGDFTSIIVLVAIAAVVLALIALAFRAFAA